MAINQSWTPPQNSGAVTLAMTLWMLPVFALIILLLVGRVNQALQVSRQAGQSDQLLQSAQAGLADGLLHLDQRQSISSLPIHYSLLMPDKSRVKVSISAQSKSTTALLLLRSDVLASDQIGRLSLSLLARWSSLLVRPPSVPLLVLGDVHLGQETYLQNDFSRIRLMTAGAIRGLPMKSRRGVATTCPEGLCQRVSAYQSMTVKTLIQTLFDRRIITLRQEAIVETCLPVCLKEGGKGSLLWFSGSRGKAIELAPIRLGSRHQPVVAIIDGDLYLRQPLTVYGLLLIRGRMRAKGARLRVFGSLVVAGDALLGPARLIYDAAVLGALKGQGDYRVVAGSWQQIADQ